MTWGLILCLAHSIIIISQRLRFTMTRWDNFDRYTWILVLCNYLFFWFGCIRTSLWLFLSWFLKIHFLDNVLPYFDHLDFHNFYATICTFVNMFFPIVILCFFLITIFIIFPNIYSHPFISNFILVFSFMLWNIM